MSRYKDSLTAILGLTVLLASAGCTGDAVDLDTPEHRQLLEQDRAEMARYEGQTIRITLNDALTRAVEKNLDARVAAMDVLAQKGNVTLKELEVLPGVSVDRTAMGRSNQGASSSRSVISGLESLEPSQSADRRRLVTEMKASWNILDSGLALADIYRMQDETGIVQQRYAKVVQNIERDVYAAYWRAWEYQQLREKTQGAAQDASRQIDNLGQAMDGRFLSVTDASGKVAAIEDRLRTVQDMSDALSGADTELKTLLSFPQSVRLEIVQPPVVASEIRSLISGDIVDQEWKALSGRPEMREEVLQKNVAIKGVRQEIFKTFPGAEALISYNEDTNSFLQDKQWSNFSLSLSQNILNLFTLPLRMEAAKTKEHQADARRQALSAAVIAQLHLARQRLGYTSARCEDAKRVERQSARQAFAAASAASAGMSSRGDSVLAQLDGRIGAMRRAQVCADMQDAYAAFINSMGQNIDHGTLAIRKKGAS